MSKPLGGKICLVTGATRGIGRGVALQLGAAGATVYITGRTLNTSKEAEIGGSLEDTKREIETKGGKCIPVQCDHNIDEEVSAVFDKIKREQAGQLDILVNNVYSAVQALAEDGGRSSFWELDDCMWDTVNGVGMRNHYLCTVHAARMMVPRKQGLIVNISSAAGLTYFFNVPMGIGKAAIDRMAADCAIELRNHNVTMISLWPGIVRTEVVQHYINKPASGPEDNNIKQIRRMFSKSETTEFSGLCIVHLALDPNLSKKSGRIFMTAELAQEYGGFKDVDGRVVQSIRSLSTILDGLGWSTLAAYVPSWIKIPYFVMTLSGSKF